MFNILDFIDSKDICEYNKTTHFEPDGIHGYFGYGHFFPLYFVKCPDEELP